MNKVKILANSVSDLLPDFAAQFGIDIIPDIIIYGNKNYRQNIDLTINQFYETIDVIDKLPTTSHPSIEEYKDYIRKYEHYEAVIVLEVTSKMSSSYDTLCIAAAELEEEGFKAKVFPFDTYLTSWGMGLMAIETAKLANEGKDAYEIMAFLENLKENRLVSVYIVLKSLRNARKSGRVGALRVLAADALGIKPVISMPDGEIKDIKLARSYENGLEDIVEFYIQRAKYGGDVYIGHSDNIEDAKWMQEKLQIVDPNANIHIGWIGSVMGIFTGSGAVGIAITEHNA